MFKSNKIFFSKNLKICVFLLSALLAIIFVASAWNIIDAPFDKALASPDKNSIVNQIESMQPILDQTSNAYAEANRQEADAKQKVNEAQERIDYCNTVIPELQKNISLTVKKQYIDGSFGIIDLLINAKSLNELTANLNALNEINQKHANTVTECKNLRQEVEEQMVVLEENFHAASFAASNARAAKEKAESTVANLQDLLNKATNEEKQEIQRRSTGGYTPSHEDYQPTGNDIVDRAKSCIGTPYVWGACSPSGFDCSGLVSYAVTGRYARIGTTGTFINYPKCDPYPGCICVIHNSVHQHCGIYIGNGLMVHAPQLGQCVCIARVQDGMIYVHP